MKFEMVDILKIAGESIVATLPMRNLEKKYARDGTILMVSMVYAQTKPRTEEYYILYEVRKNNEIIADIQFEVRGGLDEFGRYLTEGALIFKDRAEEKQQNYYFSLELEHSSLSGDGIETIGPAYCYLYSVNNFNLGEIIDCKKIMISSANKGLVDYIDYTPKKYRMRKQLEHSMKLEVRCSNYHLHSLEELTQ